MADKADKPINSGMHTGCVDDALVSMDLSEEERTKLLQVMAKAKVNIPSSPPTTNPSILYNDYSTYNVFVGIYCKCRLLSTWFCCFQEFDSSNQASPLPQFR